jgi:hypothetical protein
MDNIGSTSFILFDKNVMNCVGKTVQDLIDAHVVEKDALKDKDVNGKRSKLLDITLEDTE